MKADKGRGPDKLLGNNKRRRPYFDGYEDEPKKSDLQTQSWNRSVEMKMETARSKIGMFDDYRSDKAPILGN